MGCIVPTPGLRMLNPLFFPGLKVWWDPARLVAGSGDYLDLSGNAETGANVSVTIVAGVANGRPVGRYDGVTSITSCPLFSPNKDFSSFIVLKLPAPAGNQIGWVRTGAAQQILTANAAENLACFDGANHPTSVVIDYDTKFTSIGVVCTNGTCVFYRNGVILGNAIGGVLNNILNIGFFGAVGAFFSAFDLAETVFYTSVLNATQITVLNEYFRSKFALV